MRRRRTQCLKAIKKWAGEVRGGRALGVAGSAQAQERTTWAFFFRAASGISPSRPSTLGSGLGKPFERLASLAGGERAGCTGVDTGWARLQRPAPIVFAGEFRLAGAREQARRRARPGSTAGKSKTAPYDLGAGRVVDMDKDA